MNVHGGTRMRELDKIIGYDSIKTELYRILDIINNLDKYIKLGVSTPKGIMLSGDPGIGKTLMAKCFIEESGRESFIIRKDRANGDFVNYISEIFHKAVENAPSIILLDDMDKYANEDRYHRNAEEYVTVQTCIDEIKEKNVFVLATCNDKNALPDSLIRSGRFDKVYEMRFPEGEDAKKIVAFYLKNKKVSCDVDPEEIARFCQGRSCAELETIVNEAGIYAGFENKDIICQEDLKRACLRKIYNMPESFNVVSDESIRYRAIHESGHAVMTEIFYKGMVNFASISAYDDGFCGGMVSRNRNTKGEDKLCDKEHEIMIALAGKAATEILLNEVDMGSTSDMRKAFNNTRFLLDDYTAYDFHSWCHGEETSKRVYDHLDSVTGMEVSRYYLMTKKLLKMNMAFLEEMMDQLIKKKLLSYKDIAVIRAKHEIRTI